VGSSGGAEVPWHGMLWQQHGQHSLAKSTSCKWCSNVAARGAMGGSCVEHGAGHSLQPLRAPVASKGSRSAAMSLPRSHICVLLEAVHTSRVDASERSWRGVCDWQGRANCRGRTGLMM